MIAVSPVKNSVQKSVHSPVHSPVQSPESRFHAGHSKSRNEEMRNGKWEMWKCGNGKKVHCISLSKLLMFCYCSHL